MDSPIVEPVDVVKGCPFDLFDVEPRTYRFAKGEFVQDP
jgi:hypothetical protein